MSEVDLRKQRKVDANVSNDVTVSLSQKEDTGNSVVRTSIDGATPFVGAWTVTLANGVIRETTVVASNEPLTLGGVFTFEFSDDGIVNNGISESRPIQNFQSVRDFDLMNFGMYYRVLFTPSRPLVGIEIVSIKTILHTQYGGLFVRLAGQEIEESNSAMGNTFAYIKAFNEVTGRSENIRVDNGGLRVSTAKAMTYRVAYRNVASPYALSMSLSAGSPILLATIFRDNTAQDLLKLKKCIWHLASVTNSGVITVDLVRLTTAPTGGFLLTPDIADPNDTAPESLCRALPTGGGAFSTLIYTFILQLTNSDRNIDVNLLEELSVNDIKAPQILNGVAGGFGIIVRSDSNSTITGTVDMTFSEQAP